jgi:chromosome segregation ATPase
MPEEVSEAPVVQASESNTGKWVLLGLAALYALVSLYFLFDLRGQVSGLTKDQAASKTEIAALTQRMQAAEASSEALGQQVGLTKKELSERSEELQRAQKAAESRITKEQAAQGQKFSQQISQVSGEVGGVKTDVSGVKTDVAATKTELAATKAKLDSTIGDLGVQSGLIAHTRDDLEYLKHKGDRNYYEFTLDKGVRQAVSTVSLQLKKADPKRSKYTLNVSADDKTIEKKDRNAGEPIQFYTGRDHLLYELVVWTVDKNRITGYVSTPKNAPVPVTQ